jgi:protein SCO1/2
VYAPSRLLQTVGINQKMGAQIPLDLPFADETGRDVTLRQYFKKPVILALVYYQCPSLCNMVLNGVLSSAKSLDMTAGKQYEVIAVSFDPRETPQMAAAKKQTYLKDYQRQGAEQGWHFLTGPETSSKALAAAVGFRYVYDAMTNQYAHSSAIMILTQAGRVARYFYGIQYPPRDVRLGLVEASSERIGTPTDQVLLYCFHYDPTTGKYALVIMNVLRMAALITLGVLLTFMFVMFRRDFRAAHLERGNT